MMVLLDGDLVGLGAGLRVLGEQMNASAPRRAPAAFVAEHKDDLLPRSELAEALQYLDGFDSHGILFLIGERFQGKTKALEAIKKEWAKPGVYSTLVCCTTSDTLDFVALGYSHAMARRLLQSPECWRKIHELIKGNHLLGSDGFLGSFRVRFWSRSTRRKLEKYFCSVSQSFSEQASSVIRELASVITKTSLASRCEMLTSLFDAGHRIHIYADNVPFHAGSRHWAALREFAANGDPGSRTSLIVTASSPTGFAEFYNALVREAHRKVKIAYVTLNPMAPHNAGTQTVRGPLETPTVPGLIHPNAAREMDAEALLVEICSHAPYSQIDTAEWNHTAPFNALAAGLTWIFVRVCDEDIVRLSLALKVGADSLTRAFRDNPLLHKIDGKWEFIEGWRYFIAGRHYREHFVECVEELLVNLALHHFSNPAIDQRQFPAGHLTPSFAFNRQSYLQPATTMVFLALLRAVRRLRTKKRSSGRDRIVEVANEVFDQIASIGPVRSELAVRLCTELFLQTQRLAILDFGLSSVASGTGPLTPEEHTFMGLAAKTADRWNDTTLRQNISSTRKGRRVKEHIFVSHGHNELLMLKLKNFLATRVGGNPLILAEEPRRGLTVVEQLEQLSDRCWFAIVLMTKDDVQKDGGIRARQNVVHEIGFFQGKYGRQNVVLLAERGVEIFSNISGILRVEFDPGHFDEIFDQLRREIEAARA